MVKLNRIQFNGFRTANRNAAVKFSDAPVTVIYGENGCGKTTFLRAVHAFLSQDSAYLESIGVNSIECEFSYDKTIIREFEDRIEETIVEENCRGSILINKDESGYDWLNYESSPLFRTKSLSLGVERGVTTQQARIDTDILLSYFTHPRNREMLKNISSQGKISIHEFSDDLSRYIRMRQFSSARNKRSELTFDSAHINLQNIKLENIEQILLEHYNFARKMATRKIQNALFDTLAFAVENKNEKENNIAREQFFEMLQSSKHRLIEALDDDSSNKFKDLILEKLKNSDNSETIDLIFSNTLLKTLLLNMMEELKLERLLLNSINLLVEKFNEYLIDGKKLKISDEKVCIEADDRELQVNDLSSGERHILTFLTLVLFQGRRRDFLIIDEPEISLNIKWQRDLMSLFHELAPGTQIIVASHSPALAKRNPKYLAALKNWKGDANV